jgi:hypothetical protein
LASLSDLDTDSDWEERPVDFNAARAAMVFSDDNAEEFWQELEGIFPSSVV